ncbi:MAG: DEAD/DEAH box helicase [Thermoplasmata archaeon]
MGTVVVEQQSEIIIQMLHPHVGNWFKSKYGKLSEPQIQAIPRILNRKNVLVCAPTGSGKTLSAFLGILSNLAALNEKGKLENRVYCIYISPLKAVANDIRKNLILPLEEMGLEGNIRVSVRTGDTPQKEKIKMLKNAPHILITTPESFTILLNSRRFQEHLNKVEYVILDEIHELCASKRGTLLSAELEILEELSPGFVRIGLSATQSPIEEIAKYLGGFSARKPRRVEILNLDTSREYEIQIIYQPGIENKPRAEANLLIAKICAEIINRHRTVMIFTNTRKHTEELVQVLRGLGITAIDAHHGSLSRKRRLETEDSLKKGELRAVVTSTSLELGIDIGSVDCIIQISSPKSISKAIQRFGRAGHTLGGISMGYFISTDLLDFLECFTIIEKIERRELDHVEIPVNSLDVLAQVLIGMGIHRTWKIKEALKILKRAYAYHHLKKKELESVLHALSQPKTGRVDYHAKLEEFTTRRSAATYFYENVGTIPQEQNYQVFDEYGEHLGTLSEKFAEFLKPGDSFILGARVYDFVRRSSSKIFVKESTQKHATVPSWVGEINARTPELSRAIGETLEMLSQMDEPNLKKYLSRRCANEESVMYILTMIKKQKELGMPGNKKILVEWVEEEGRIASVVLSIAGRKVNEAVARYIASKLNLPCEMIVEDNGFAILTEDRIFLEALPNAEVFTTSMEKLIRNSDIFLTRFKQSAIRSFLILRNLRGKRASSFRISRQMESLLEKIHQKHPIYIEAMRESLYETLDLPNAVNFLERIKKRELQVYYGNGNNLSPFSLTLLNSVAKDSGFWIEKLRRIRKESEVKRYLLNEEILKFGFGSKEDALEFMQKYHVFHYPDENLEALVKEGKIHKGDVAGRKVYLYPDASSILEELKKGLKSKLLREICKYILTMPATAEEVATMLGVGHRDVEKTFQELLEDGNIVPVIVNGNEKFLSAPFLEFVLAKTSEYISRAEMDSRISAAVFGVKNIDECFQNFLGIRDPYVLFVRGLEKNWHPDDVLYGKYIGGRSVFVHVSDIPLLQSIYSLPLTENEKKVWKMLARPMSFSELKKYAGISSLRETLDKLEIGVLLKKKDGDPVIYEALPLYPRISEAEEICIERIVKGFGAVSVDFLSRYLNLPFEKVDAIVNNLVTKHKIKRAKILGTERTVFFSDEKLNGKMPESILLSAHDPYLEHRWAEIAGMLSEAYNLVYVSKSALAAFVNCEVRDDFLQVHSIWLKEENYIHLPEIWNWLIKYAKYRDVSIVHLNKIGGKWATEFTTYFKQGFFKSGSAIIHSELPYIEKVFPFDEIFARVLVLQGIPKLSNDALTVIEKYFGVMNEEELLLRAMRFAHPEELKNIYYAYGLSGGGYFTEQQISILKAIKSYGFAEGIAEEMKEILSNLDKPKTADELYSSVSISHRRFRAVLGTMLKTNIVYEAGGGILKITPEHGFSRTEATEFFIKKLLEQFGITNPSLISSYTRNLIRRDVAKNCLIKLVKEGLCAVGFVIENIEELFYIHNQFLSVKPSTFTGVISPEDRTVRYFSGIMKKLTGRSAPYIVLRNGKITGFAKAKRKGKAIYLEEFGGDEDSWEIFREYLYNRDYVLRK